MKRIYLSLIMCMLFAGNILAGDNLYDLYYGRPSYFPQFTVSTAYANNMNYIVVVKSDEGLPIPNYEVAVYDQNDELRAIARSQVNSNDICMLNICGTEGDIFRFEVLYGDFVQPTITKAVESVKFKTNDIVGLDTPYTLTISDSSIGVHDVQAEVKVIEVFSKDGLKLSSLQHGINIVRMNDGSVKKILNN